MMKSENYIYGTVEECVAELVKPIDWSKPVFPEFDFCSEVYDNITQEELECGDDGTNLGECWYGCRDASYVFDSQRECFVLLFGYWGGVGYEMLEIDFDEIEFDDCPHLKKEKIIRDICLKICAVSGLKLDSETVFELI